MYEIISIPIRKYELVDLPIKQDQLIYCTDTKEAYYDLDSEQRIQIGCTIQVDTERDRIQIVEPLQNKVYIVIESNKLYTFHSKNWHLVTNRPEIIDDMIPANELMPTTLKQKGIHLAPKTLASEVYTNDGRPVQNVIDEMLSENKKILLYTKTAIVEVERDGQRVFNIPFPIPNYDIDKFPVLIFVNNEWIPGSNYAISIDQLIFDETFDILHKGDLITFIFNYNVTVSPDDTIDATSLNGIRFFVGPIEPMGKLETDVWFDTLEKSVKQYDGSVWQIIVKNQDFKIDIEKSTYTLNTAVDKIPIGISDINSEHDLIFVYENSIYIEENEDYTIDSDGLHITKVDGRWQGDIEETVFNFIVFRNVKQTGENSFTSRRSSSLSKEKILKSLGITEDELNKLKSLIKEV